MFCIILKDQKAAHSGSVSNHKSLNSIIVSNNEITYKLSFSAWACEIVITLNPQHKTHFCIHSAIRKDNFLWKGKEEITL